MTLKCRAYIFQSTHPSGVRLILGGLLQQSGINFNPRTPVGCDDSTFQCSGPTGDFNPRTPVGCDKPMTSRTPRPTLFQSTHPSGVRPCTISPDTARVTYFNPRTPVGCDYNAILPSIVVMSFQSTHPSGVRPGRTSNRTGVWDFNPRTPVGCDGLRILIESRNSLFQSTHPSGVRRRSIPEGEVTQ